MQPNDLTWQRLSDNSGEYCSVGDYELCITPVFYDKRRFRGPFAIRVAFLDPEDHDIILDSIFDTRSRTTITKARRAVLSLYRWARRNKVK